MAAGTLNVASLKNVLLSADLVEQKVEVNQRHLVDKILARYASEFTIYRELIQNANDAGASEVEILFHLTETDKHMLVSAVEVRNDGRPFTEEDWQRLRKIAEGNPDESKIGMFGVGFYSVFQITESPLISSGGQCMSFFWRGDQLVTKRGSLPSSKSTSTSNAESRDTGDAQNGDLKWTTFYLVVRELEFLPEMDSFSRFLATSLSFTRNLKRISVYACVPALKKPSSPSSSSSSSSSSEVEDGGLDSLPLVLLKKTIEVATPLVIPRDAGIIFNSPNNIFWIENVLSSPVILELQRSEHKRLRRALITDTGVNGNSPISNSNSGNSTSQSSAGAVGSNANVLYRPSIFGLFQTIFSSVAPTASASSSSSSSSAAVVASSNGANSPITVSPAPEKSASVPEPAVKSKSSALRLRLLTAELRVDLLRQSWGKQFIIDMERSVKKKPPSKTIASILLEETQKSDFVADSAWDEVHPKAGAGRVFIGFITNQTTGIAAHIGAQLIPTVERENIDFVDKCLSLWNRELLAALGAVVRIAYESRILAIVGDIHQARRGSSSSSSSSEREGPEQQDKDKEALVANTAVTRANQLISSLAVFAKTSPSNTVGGILSEYFWRSSTKGPLLWSAVHGSLNSTRFLLDSAEDIEEMRRGVPTLRSFLSGERSPVLDKQYISSNAAFLDELRRRNMVRELAFTHLLEEFEAGHVFNDAKDLVIFLKFLAKSRRDKRHDIDRVLDRLKAAVKVKMQVSIKSTSGQQQQHPSQANANSAAGGSATSALSGGNADSLVIATDSLVADARSAFQQFSSLLFGVTEESAKASSQPLPAQRQQQQPHPQQQESTQPAVVPTNSSVAPSTVSPSSSSSVSQMALAQSSTNTKRPELTEPQFQTVLYRLRDWIYWVDSKWESSQLPLPPNVVPFDITRRLSRNEIAMDLGLWKELSVRDWCFFLVSQPDMESSASFSEKTLTLISKQIATFSPNDQALLLSNLSNRAIIPTNMGMKKPAEAYFKLIIFNDLPVCSLNINHVPRDLLRQLGVRQNIELQTLFDRMTDLEWDQVKLIRYLASVSATLTPAEWTRLSQTQMMVADADESAPGAIAKSNPVASPPANGVTANSDEKQLPSPSASNSEPGHRLFLPSEIFFPTDENKSLGLRVVKWKGNLRKDSEEGMFLLRVGVRLLCPLSQLLQLIANNKSKSQLAIQYLLKGIESYGKEYPPKSCPEFLPCQKEGQLAHPWSCFASASCAILGFSVLHSSLTAQARELAVREHPPSGALVEALSRRLPRTEAEAKEVFAYLASRMGDFQESDWRALRSVRFIPIFPASISDSKAAAAAAAAAESSSSSSSSKALTSASSTVAHGQPQQQLQVRHIEPQRAYFKSAENTYAEFFDYVDFGAVPNQFLQACGVRKEPSPEELAIELINDADRFLESLGVERYLMILRQLAISLPHLSRSSIVRKMSQARILIGFQQKEASSQQEVNSTSLSALSVPQQPTNPAGQPQGSSAGSASTKPENMVYRLAMARDISLVDDVVYGSLFNPTSAPMEALLEELYAQLGSQWLSKEVRSSFVTKGSLAVGPLSTGIENSIRERGPLLLYDGQKQRRDVLPNASKILKTLKVYEVKAIERRLEFRTQVRSHPVSACMVRTTMGQPCLVVSITGDIDHFDIGSALSSLIFEHGKLQDSLLVATLLTTPLNSLRSKGFPVDRLLNIPDQRASQAALDVAAKQQQQSVTSTKSAADSNVASKGADLTTGGGGDITSGRKGDAKSGTDATTGSSQQNGTVATKDATKSSSGAISSDPANLNGGSGHKSDALPRRPSTSADESRLGVPAALAAQFAQLVALFPDCDPSFLIQLMLRFKNDHVEQVANRLLDENYPRRRALPTPPPSSSSSSSAPSSSSSSASSSSTPPRTSSASSSGRAQESMQGGVPAVGGGGADGKSILNKLTTGGVGGTSGQPLKIDEKNAPLYKSNLNNMLRSSIRNLQSGNVTSMEHPETMIEAPIDMKNQCETIPGQSLSLIGRFDGIPTFVSKNEPPSVVFERNEQVIEFAKVLSDICLIFGIQKHTINIYWDGDAKSIAFNRSRSLFFNLKFFVSLHADELMAGQDRHAAIWSCYGYWYLVFCHELAHNFVIPHNSHHEYYLTAFAAQYLRALSERVNVLQR